MAKSRGLKKNLLAAVLLGAMAATGASAATLSLVQSGSTAVGGTLILDVRISDAVDLYTYDYTINFNAANMTFVGATEGAFLATGGFTYYIPGSTATAGSYSYSANTLLGAPAGVNGTGLVERLTFTVASALPTTFSFSNVDLVNSAFGTIATTATSLTVTPVPEPATYAMLGLGLAAVGGLAAKRRRAA